MSVKFTPVFLLVITWPQLVLADGAKKEYPESTLPALGGMNFFEQDGAAEYIRRFATTPPPDAELEYEKGIPIERPHRSSPFFTSSVVGEIVVVEGSGGYTYTNPCPSPYQDQTCTFFNDNAVIDIANEVLRQSQDQHDMIVLFTTFAQTGSGYAAYYLPLQNDIVGLGDCNENNGESHGCLFDSTGGRQLQGLIYMSSVGSWRWQEERIYGSAKPITDVDAWVYGGVGHETLHRWGSALRFKHPGNGAVSKAMLGESLAHWNPSVDAAGSMHYGFDWVDNGDGSYDLLDDNSGFWDLDLYAMGVLPPDEVEPWFMIENGFSEELSTLMRAMGYNFSGNLSSGPGLFIPMPPVDAMETAISHYYPHMGPHISATGQRLDLTIQDVIDAEGARDPAYGEARTSFSQVWVLVTGPDQRTSQVGNFVTELDTVRKTFEQWFVDRTRGRARICTRISDTCPEPRLVSRGLYFDDSESNKDGVADPDESVDFFPVVANEGVGGAHQVTVTAKALNDKITFDRSEATIGDLDSGAVREASKSLLAYVSDKVSCGEPVVFETTVQAADSPPVSQLAVVYAGLKPIVSHSFEDSDEGWTFNPGNEDGATQGAFAWGTPQASFSGTSRATPGHQTSGGGTKALLTDPEVVGGAVNHDVDNGFTTVLSPPYATKDLKDPHIGYRYWHVATFPSGTPKEEDENKLMLELSKDDGKSFVEVAVHTKSDSRWNVGMIRLLDHYQEVPESVRLRVTQFDGADDHVVEGGIDDVQLFDLGGKCTPEGCGCSTSSLAPSQGVLLGMLVVAVLLWRRRGASLASSRRC